MDFNLADLLECVAGTVPEREAVVAGERRLTYRSLDREANRVAAGLAERGAAAGQHVGLHLYNCAEHLAAMLACFKLRAVPINLNYRYTEAELAAVASDAGLAAAFHDPDLPPLAGVPLVVDLGDPYRALAAEGDPDRDFGPRSGDDRYVLYTGGTTGRPKGVVWRQEDIFFAVLGGGNPGGPPIERPEEIARTVLANRAQRLRPYLPPDDPGPDEFVVLSLGPLMHASGQWSALGTLLGGGKVVLYTERHVDMARVLDLVARERVVALNLVGDASAVPLLDALAGGGWDTSSVRLIGSGGAILTGEVKQRLLDALPSVLAITEAIGSSESPVQGLSIVTRDGGAGPSLRFASRPETMVVDDDLRPVAPGSGRAGRLATRGRVPLGYHNDPAKSAATFVEIDGTRWALPGDMATVEADGSIRLLGRGALCINTGGEKVYPEEVEAVLKAHPAVADAVVVGVADPTWGERVVAVVQPTASDDPPALADLQAHCRNHLAAYKVPRAVHMVRAVERSPAGKADYRWARAVAGPTAYGVAMADVVSLLAEVVPGDRVVAGEQAEDYWHDEALGAQPQAPAAVVFPTSTDEVASVLRVAAEHRLPVTARGSGTGLSGAAVPVPGGVVVAFERMNRVLEIDVDNQVAVVQPGVTLAELDAVTAAHGLVYPVFPGEYSASLGGNVGTNAGGMRAVKYGVTRHQVLGLEAVLATGEVIRTGGRFVKGSTGYDLTQLVIGSEGTLAVVTEATLRLYPRPEHQSTVLAPFTTLDGVTAAVPRVVASGIGPLILEYIDKGTMGAMAAFSGIDLGVPAAVQEEALAYLVVMMENRSAERLDEDTEALAEHLAELGAIDVYVLPPQAAVELISAREKAFWIAKANHADDIVDVVVPRAAISAFMADVRALGERTGTLVAGCGHAGDGNVHLSVFQPDPEVRAGVLRSIFELGMALGGVISGEHGIGVTKKKYFLELEDPVKVDLMRRIKQAFDPDGILNPGTLFD